MRFVDNPRTVSFTIFDAEKLDPVTVFMQDFGGGCGRLVVECWCTAWAAYWGAMGTRDVREFVLDAHADYIAGRMHPQDRKHLKRDEAYLLRIVKVVQQALREGAGTSGVAPSQAPRLLTDDEVAECDERYYFKSARSIQRKFCEVNGLPQPDPHGSGVAPSQAHSKSEYKRRVAMGDPNVAPPLGVEVMASGPLEDCHGAIAGGVKACVPTVKAWEHSCPGYPARVLLPQGSKCTHCGATDGSSAAAPFGMEADDHEYDELGLPPDAGVTEGRRQTFCDQTPMPPHRSEDGDLPDKEMKPGNTKCNPHPEAPHGFNRNASHNAGRYVCDCEGWMPPGNLPA